MLSLLIAQAAPADPTGGWVSIVQNISGWVALVALLLSGFVVLRKPFYTDLQHERDLLRESLDKERERNNVLQNSVQTVIEQNKMVIHLVESIKDGARHIQ